MSPGLGASCLVKNFLSEKDSKNLLTYLPYIASVLIILRSRPFLKLPYDMWHHLMLIRGWYQDGQPFVTRPGVGYHEVLWHRLWAELFKLLHVSDVFIWARIIHCTQFMWAIFCTAYFSDVILKHLDNSLSASRRRLLALMGAWCFILGAGTFSVQYQLSWILWYGVNYQGFTLPAYFLAIALLLDVVMTEDSRLNKLKIISLPIIFSAMIAIHPLEAGYLLVALALFALFFASELIEMLKKSPAMGLAIITPFFLAPILLFILPLLGLPLPRPAILRGGFDLITTWHEIQRLGGYVQKNGLHRGLSSFNELPVAGCVVLIFLMGYQVASKKITRSKLTNSKTRLWVFILALSVGFAMLPRLSITSGVFALLTDPDVVWRFAFASPWFVGFSIWALLPAKRYKSVFASTSLALAPIILVFVFSRFFTSGPFNTTAASVVRSLELKSDHNVSIQFDRYALRRLDDIVLSTPAPPKPKKNIYLIRSDLQTYVRAATGAFVLGDRLGSVSRSLFDRMPDRESYQLITIEAPTDLPVDAEMARAFPSMGLLQ
jgi:hypothetical protein